MRSLLQPSASSLRAPMPIRSSPRLSPLHRSGVSRALGSDSGAMTTLLSDEKEIRDIIAKNEWVVMDFMATWCRKCITVKPKIERLHNEDFPSIPFAYINVNEAPYSLMTEFKVEVMPTFVVVRRGKEVARMKGGEDIKAVVDRLRELIKEVTAPGATDSML